MDQVEVLNYLFCKGCFSRLFSITLRCETSVLCCSLSYLLTPSLSDKVFQSIPAWLLLTTSWRSDTSVLVARLTVLASSWVWFSLCSIKRGCFPDKAMLMDQWMSRPLFSMSPNLIVFGNCASVIIDSLLLRRCITLRIRTHNTKVVCSNPAKFATEWLLVGEAMTAIAWISLVFALLGIQHAM